MALVSQELEVRAIMYIIISIGVYLYQVHFVLGASSFFHSSNISRH